MVYRYIGVWVYGCIGVRVYGCTGVRAYNIITQEVELASADVGEG
jgi:hypothetical protein